MPRAGYAFTLKPASPAYCFHVTIPTSSLPTLGVSSQQTTRSITHTNTPMLLQAKIFTRLAWGSHLRPCAYASYATQSRFMHVAPSDHRAAQYLDTLNEEQQESIYADAKAVRLVAGPGSGKTRVIVAKILSLLQSGVSPRSIMAVTFTNKAAGELKERLTAVLPEATVKHLTAGTFHSICLLMLKRDIQGLADGWDRDFLVYDEDERELVIRHVLEQGMRVEPQQARKLAEILGPLMSKLWNRVPQAGSLSGAGVVEEGRVLELLPETMNRADEAQLAILIDGYKSVMRTEKSVDFDWLLLLAAKLLRDLPAVLDQYHRRYSHLLVDEFQDTNQPQYELVQLLTGPTTRLVVVGDPNQAIYRWRGACPTNMRDKLEEDFELSLSTHALRTNYRSTPAIVAVAESIINTGGRPTYHYPTHAVRPQPPPSDPSVLLVEAHSYMQEADFVASRIAALHELGVRYDNVLVLYRTKMLSHPIGMAMAARGVPYVVLSGNSFWQSKEVKMSLMYLRLAANPHDDFAVRKSLNHASRGIGPSTRAKMEQAAQQQEITLAALLMCGCVETRIPEPVVERVMRAVASVGMEAVQGLAPPIPQQLADQVKLTKKAAGGLQDLRNLVVLMRNVARWKTPSHVVGVLLDAFYRGYIEAGGEETAKKGDKDKRQIRLQNLGTLQERASQAIQTPDNNPFFLEAESDGSEGNLGPEMLATRAPEAAASSGTSKPDVVYAQAVTTGGKEGAPPVTAPPNDQPLPTTGLAALNAFLSAVVLETNADTEEDERDRVRLMTVHNAKGLEAGVVFLVGAEEGRLPVVRQDATQEELDEEKNIAYVAATRAQDLLVVSWTQTPRPDRRSDGTNDLSRYMRKLATGTIPGTQCIKLGPPRQYGQAAGGRTTYSKQRW